MMDMTREEVIDFAVTNVKRAVTFSRWKCRGDLSLVEDCQQEGVLAVIETAAELVSAIDAGEPPDDLIFKIMRRGAGRALSRHLSRGTRSLDESISVEAEDLTLSSMLVYHRQESPENVVDARRVVETMECLDGQELAVLMAFADGVELGDVAKEQETTPLETLTIRNRAIKKVESGLFGLMAEKLLLASIKAPKADVAKQALKKAS